MNIYERMQKRRRELERKALEAYDREEKRLASLFRRTGNKIYLWMAKKKGYEPDFIEGIDDGETMEKEAGREANYENLSEDFELKQ